MSGHTPGPWRVALATTLLIACAEAPDQENVVIRDETVARLSRQLAQQDSYDDAFIAFRLLAREAGQKGLEAIMALDRAGTMNETVWRAVRAGDRDVVGVCLQLPDFTACVQNAARRELLGIPNGIVGTFQISCRDLARVREAFRPEEFKRMVQGCAEAGDTAPERQD